MSSNWEYHIISVYTHIKTTVKRHITHTWIACSAHFPLQRMVSTEL